MDLSVLEQVIQLMEKYGLQELTYKLGDTEISLGKPVTQNPSPLFYPTAGFRPNLDMYPAPVGSPQPPSMASVSPATPPPSEVQKLRKEVRTPFVGTFYASSSPKSEPFVHVGKRVKKGDTLCIIEAMKLMNEIEAEQDGVIAAILVSNEHPVEFNQVLFLME